MTLPEMAETFIKEITEGIGGSGIKAGIIKVATQANRISPCEEMVLRAAARTAKATGTRITTHTDDGAMGREQLDIFAAEGVNLRHVIVGHSCGQPLNSPSQMPTMGVPEAGSAGLAETPHVARIICHIDRHESG